MTKREYRKLAIERIKHAHKTLEDLRDNQTRMLAIHDARGALSEALALLEASGDD